LLQTSLDTVHHEARARRIVIERILSSASHALLPMHDENARSAQFAHHGRNLHVDVVTKVEAKIAKVARFLHEIQLLEQFLRELIHQERR